MTRNTSSAHTGVTGRVRRVWSELDYAQRRLFEIQTGVTAPTRRMTVDDLEALYAESARR